DYYCSSYEGISTLVF
nr:immunoglobulin light chain junction region [Macaca mulatta]